MREQILEEEIDLRPYIEALLQKWKWIAGVAILTALTTYATISFLPPTYETIALVTIIGEGDILEFDSRIRSVNERQPLQAFPELAVSDSVLQLLFDQASLEGVGSLQALRNLLEAEAGEDPKLIRLIVRSQDPISSAQVANLWAEIFVAHTNEIYGIQGGEQLHFFEDQLNQSEIELEQAEEALIAFQSLNRTTIISNTLSFSTQEQATYLSDQRSVTLLLQNAQELQAQLIEEQANSSVTVSDQLTALMLQLQAFNAQATIPFLIQVDSTSSFTGANQSEQIAFLDRLVQGLEEKLSLVETQLAELEPQILELQQRYQEELIRYDRLLRNRTIAQEAVISLARKVQEERIASQDTSAGGRLASRAAVPTKPISSHKRLGAVGAGLFGLLLGVFGIIVKVWWQTSELLNSNPEKNMRTE